MILFDIWVNHTLSKNECYEMITKTISSDKYDMVRLFALGRQQIATALFVSNIFYSRGHNILTFPYIFNDRHGIQLYIEKRKSILYHRLKSNVSVEEYLNELKEFQGSQYIVSGCGLACVNALEIMTLVSMIGWRCVHTSYGNASQYKDDDISLKTTIRLEFSRVLEPHGNPNTTVFSLNNEHEFPAVGSDNKR